MQQKKIICARSGVLLGHFVPTEINVWPVTDHEFFATLYHPVYNKPIAKLIRTTDALLRAAMQADWELDDAATEYLGLHVSALMYSMGGMWIPPEGSQQKILPSLPSLQVLAINGFSIVEIAGWMHYETGRRFSLPVYRVSQENYNWQNLRWWVDGAWAVKDQWERTRPSTEHMYDVLINKAAADDGADIEGEVSALSVFSKIDPAKVWSWIVCQFGGSFTEARLAEYKKCFLKGEDRPQDVYLDLVVDLSIDIQDKCNPNAPIMEYVRWKITGIRAAVKEFYSSFQITSFSAMGEDDSEEEKEKAQAMETALSRQAAEIAELPPAPVREDYSSLGKFLQAQAKWRLLSTYMNKKVG